MVGWGGLPVFRSLGWLRLVGLLRRRPSGLRAIGTGVCHVSPVGLTNTPEYTCPIVRALAPPLSLRGWLRYRCARVCRHPPRRKQEGEPPFRTRHDSPRACGLSNTSEVGRARVERRGRTASRWRGKCGSLAPKGPERKAAAEGRQAEERGGKWKPVGCSLSPRHGWRCRPGSFECRRRRAASRHPTARLG